MLGAGAVGASSDEAKLTGAAESFTTGEGSFVTLPPDDLVSGGGATSTTAPVNSGARLRLSSFGHTDVGGLGPRGEALDSSVGALSYVL